MGRYTVHRKDANEAEIVKGLRDAGATVSDWGDDGCPDLVVGFRGRNYLMEVKMPGKTLNPKQQKWHTSWNGDSHVVENLDMALWIIGAVT